MLPVVAPAGGWAGLNLLLLTLGWSTIRPGCCWSHRSRALSDLVGIDVVVGAKGSPMVLDFVGRFNLDVPTAQSRSKPLRR
jgi:hypothetical protein